MVENSEEYCTVVFASALTHSLQSTASVTCKANVSWLHHLPCARHDYTTTRAYLYIKISSTAIDYAHAYISDRQLDSSQLSLKRH